MRFFANFALKTHGYEAIYFFYYLLVVADWMWW